MTIPSAERQAEFLATMPNAVVATIRPGGLPQLTPVWYLWKDGVFLISVAAATAKARNLRRDPRIVLCIDDSVSGDYVQVTGTARLIEGDAVREPTIELCRKYMAEDALEAHWAGLEATGPQLLIEVTPDRFLWHDRVE